MPSERAEAPRYGETTSPRFVFVVGLALVKTLSGSGGSSRSYGFTPDQSMCPVNTSCGGESTSGL